MMSQATPVGSLLREWRQRRRLSQLDLALETEISQRHLSFVESGRSSPSRDMILRLCEQLAIPLRERNVVLVAAGFAPFYGERRLDAPELAAEREAVELILKGHEPHPALAVDRHWTLVSANGAVGRLLAAAGSAALEPPVNVLRLSLHPDGLASRIVNLREWRAHVLARLTRQIENSADPVLMELVEELKSFAVPPGAAPCRPSAQARFGGVAVPLVIESDLGRLSFITTTTVFGTALDITLSELVIESFFPADPQTAAAMRELAGN